MTQLTSRMGALVGAIAFLACACSVEPDGGTERLEPCCMYGEVQMCRCSSDGGYCGWFTECAPGTCAPYPHSCPGESDGG